MTKVLTDFVCSSQVKSQVQASRLTRVCKTRLFGIDLVSIVASTWSPCLVFPSVAHHQLDIFKYNLLRFIPYEWRSMHVLSGRKLVNTVLHLKYKANSGASVRQGQQYGKSERRIFRPSDFQL